MFRSQVVPLFVARLAALGVDAAGLLHRFRLPADVISRREVEVPLGVVAQLGEEAERLSGDAHFGLHAALWVPRGAYGLLEFIVRSARDVREAASRLVRYHRMFNDLSVLALDVDERRAVLTHGIPGRPDGVGRHANELVIAMMVRVLRESLGDNCWSPQRVAFSHAAPPDDAEVRAWFGVDAIAYQRAHNELEVVAADLTRPLASADSALLAVLDEQAMQHLLSKPQSADAARLSEAVRVAFRDGAPRLAAVAHELGISARTLQRQLEARGTSFAAVVDEIRRELACMYLDAGSLRDPEIAFLLGYAERRAFVRAFKRWTGTTPSAYRRGR